MARLIDIHSHLYFEEFDADREAVIERMQAADIATISIGTTIESSKAAIDLAKKYSWIPASVGIHPLSVKDYADQSHEQVLSDVGYLARKSEVVAVGEIGLDFATRGGGTISFEHKVLQTVLFEGQLKIAAEVGKPVIIHCRAAYPEVIAIIEKHLTASPKLHIHFHFFAGTLEELKKILDLGCTVSYTGVVTFAESYIPLVAATPLDRMMVETDAPYVAPVPWRGKRAEPWMVEAIAQKIAEIKGVDVATIATATTANAKRIFGAKSPWGA